MFTKSARFYDAIYASKDYAGEAEYLHRLIQQHDVPDGATLLDVACGTGQHLERLQQKYYVEGCDLDEALLAIARERCPDVLFHQGDMRAFDLGKTFDVVTCLFSAIGYMKTPDGMREAITTMRRHMRPGGLLIVEPWLMPEAYHAGTVHLGTVEGPDLKIARMNVSAIENGVSILDFHYLIGTSDGVEYATERHELGLFRHEEYMAAFREAGLVVTFDEEGVAGRGLYIGQPPT